MKRFLSSIFILFSFLLTSCKKEDRSDTIRFVVSADYPPFEFIKNGQLTGFDVDLATLIAKEMGKKVEFENIPFSSMLSSVKTGKVDAAISTITPTEERSKEFDFSEPYYFEKVAVIYKVEDPIKTVEDLHSKKISCLLGSVQEIWVKNHIVDASLTPLKHTNQAVESLKAGHVDAVVIDGIQAIEFVKNNQGLGFSYISESEDGFAIALKKGSKLKKMIDEAIKTLNQNGQINTLKKKWIRDIKDAIS